jgi:hypothetical protein
MKSPAVVIRPSIQQLIAREGEPNVSNLNRVVLKIAGN